MYRFSLFSEYTFAAMRRTRTEELYGSNMFASSNHTCRGFRSFVCLQTPTRLVPNKQE